MRKTLTTIEKAYKRNLKAEKQADSQNNIVTKAKEAVENVIGK